MPQAVHVLSRLHLSLMPKFPKVGCWCVQPTVWYLIYIPTRMCQRKTHLVPSKQKTHIQRAQRPKPDTSSLIHPNPFSMGWCKRDASWMVIVNACIMCIRIYNYVSWCYTYIIYTCACVTTAVSNQHPWHSQPSKFKGFIYGRATPRSLMAFKDPAFAAFWNLGASGVQCGCNQNWMNSSKFLWSSQMFYNNRWMTSWTRCFMILLLWGQKVRWEKLTSSMTGHLCLVFRACPHRVISSHSESGSKLLSRFTKTPFEGTFHPLFFGP